VENERAGRAQEKGKEKKRKGKEKAVTIMGIARWFQHLDKMFQKKSELKDTYVAHWDQTSKIRMWADYGHQNMESRRQ
jgi:hypothetical protein